MSRARDIADGTLNSADINGGNIDGTTIGGATPAAGTFTTFTSTGIDDNLTSGGPALTIDSSGSVTLSGTANDIGTVTSGTFNGTIGDSARGTMVLLADQVVTNSTLVAITLPSTTNVHRFVIDAEFYSSASDNINFIIKDSSGTAFTCRVAGQRNWGDGASGPSNLTNSGTTGPGILVVYALNAYSKANIILDYGSASFAPNWEATSHQYAGSYSFYDQRAAYATSTGVVTSVEFDVVGSSTITGSYKIYGIKK